MAKSNKSTKKNMLLNQKTRKNKYKSENYNSTSIFEKEVTKVFLEMIIMIKLWHWKTHSYATHKATDELYSKLNESMDKFIEVLLGKTNTRIDLSKQKSLPLLDFTNTGAFKNKIFWFKSYLVDLDKNHFMKKMSNTDLLNIRDEILANLNQFLYLLSFH